MPGRVPQGYIGLGPPAWLQEMMQQPSVLSQMQALGEEQKARIRRGEGPPQAGTPEAQAALGLAGNFDFTGPVGGLGATIKAYHGSPHTFDRFDMSKIGTGEGAQAYGHGLYYAESPGVAKSYAEGLSHGQSGRVRLDGKEHHPGNLADEFWFTEAEKQRLPSDPENYSLKESSSAYSGWLQAFDDIANRGGMMTSKAALNPKDDFDAGYLAARTLLKSKDATGLGPGNTYTVNLDVNHDDLLDWDAPLSQQSEKVRKALAPVIRASAEKQANDIANQSSYFMNKKERAEQLESVERVISGTTGKLFLQSLDRDPAEISRRLLEAGIPGLRYLDLGSRAGGEGTRNFVLFDDSLAQILERNGQPLP